MIPTPASAEPANCQKPQRRLLFECVFPVSVGTTDSMPELPSNESPAPIVASPRNPLTAESGRNETLFTMSVSCGVPFLLTRSPWLGNRSVNGSVLWERAVSFDTTDGFSNNLSYANGSVWIRNSSNELVAVDGVTGKPATRSRQRLSGWATAEVLATTATVVVFKTGARDSDNSPNLRAVHTVGPCSARVGLEEATARRRATAVLRAGRRLSPGELRAGCATGLCPIGW